jgi:hypothetical protein
MPRPRPYRTAGFSLESEIGVVGLGRVGKGAAGVKDGRRKKEAEVGLRHATRTADRQGSASEVGKAILDIGLDGCMCEDCIL